WCGKNRGAEVVQLFCCLCPAASIQVRLFRRHHFTEFPPPVQSRYSTADDRRNEASPAPRRNPRAGIRQCAKRPGPGASEALVGKRTRLAAGRNPAGDRERMRDRTGIRRGSACGLENVLQVSACVSSV